MKNMVGKQPCGKGIRGSRKGKTGYQQTHISSCDIRGCKIAENIEARRETFEVLTKKRASLIKK